MFNNPGMAGASASASNVQSTHATKPAAEAALPKAFVRSHDPAGMNLQVLDTAHARTLQDVAQLALSLDIRNLTPEQVACGGFLTLPEGFGPDVLRRMATLPSVVAFDEGGRASGFMLMSEPQADSPSPFVRGMVRSFQEGSHHDGRPWAIYGPIGVALNQQGRGLAPVMFRQLSEQARQAGKELLVGFLDNENVKSMAWHISKLGFVRAGEFRVNDRPYSVIVFDLARSSLREA